MHVNVSDLSAVWSTPRGNTSEPNFLGTLSNWFSLVKEENSGGVSAVYYPRTESNATVAFKKSLSQLISIVAVVTRTVEDGRVFVVRGKSQRSEGRNYVDVQKVSCCCCYFCCVSINKTIVVVDCFRSCVIMLKEYLW